MRSLVVGLLASVAALGLPPMSAHAGSFSISPIRLDLSATARTAALTVRNDDREALVQAEIMLWEQVDGQDRLTPTRDLLVSPAVFTLPPNGSQLVRVALRSPPADATRELSYRLILQEVPQTASPGFSGLQVALRLSVPVFVAIAGTTGPVAYVVCGRHRRGSRAHRAEFRRRTCSHPRILGDARGGRWRTARTTGRRIHFAGPVKALEPRPEPGGHDTAGQLAPSAVEDQHRRR